MQEKYNTHVKRIVLLLVIVAVVGFIAKKIFTPSSFGKYGFYRADAILEEVNRPIRHGTNDSCLRCHPHERELHLKGKHSTISCEFCHGVYADHIKDGKYAGKLPIKRNKEITILCLRCHNKAIQARPHKVIKTVEMPKHLKDKGVRTDHTCNQCHYVHAPLLYINQAKMMLGLQEAK